MSFFAHPPAASAEWEALREDVGGSLIKALGQAGRPVSGSRASLARGSAAPLAVNVSRETVERP